MTNQLTTDHAAREAKPVRRIRFCKHGLAENPEGYQVAMHWKGRELLGDVLRCEYNHTRGVFNLTVRHFNGEIWPIQPVASAVQVLG